MGLCGPEDVMDGSGSQHLPHGFIDDLLVLATAYRHRAQEAHLKYLLQEGVCRNTQASLAHYCEHHEHQRTRERVNERADEKKGTFNSHIGEEKPYRRFLLSSHHLFLQKG